MRYSTPTPALQRLIESSLRMVEIKAGQAKDYSLLFIVTVIALVGIGAVGFIAVGVYLALVLAKWTLM